MGTGVPILSIAGIRIRAHWSVLLVAGLLAWGLAGGVIPSAAPSTPLVLRWGLGIVAAVLLIVSLTAHELAHSLVARRLGVAVDGITLWVFGGVSHIHDDWDTPGTELRVATAGPAATLVISALLLGITLGLSSLGAPLLAVVIAQWLFAVNVLLLVFNLVPAFPLDGGRIVRGVIWKLRGNRRSATIAAARAGRAFALLLMVLGVIDFFLTTDIGGIWLVFVGWFLDNAARREQQGEVIRNSLAGVRVRDAMSRDPVLVPSWITVQLLVEQYIMRSQFTSFPTHGLDGRIDGLVTLHNIRRVPPHQRSTRRASDIAVPIAQVPTASPDDLLTDVLPRLGAQTEGRALVFENDQLAGIVSPRDIARLLTSMAPSRGAQPSPPVVPQPPPLPPEQETPARSA
jgi:Zn-dependent protease